jgi:predicted TIM-barrel enzyme
VTNTLENRGTGSVAAIVGTSLDRDGHTWNPVDPDRVDRLMDAVWTLRKGRRITHEIRRFS